MQDLSFRVDEPVFRFSDLIFTVRVYPKKWFMYLDKDKLELERFGDGLKVMARDLRYSDRFFEEGSFIELEVKRVDNKYIFSLTGEPRRVVKSLCISFRGFDECLVPTTSFEFTELPGRGVIYDYPGRWSNIALGGVVRIMLYPFVILKFDDFYWYFLFDDWLVRPKSFAVYRRDDSIRVDAVHHEDARYIITKINMPKLIVGKTKDPKEVFRLRLKTLREVFGLEKWESRSDVPSWFKEVKLVVNLHGCHWTYYIFNTYDDMRASLEWIGERINGKHVLVYLPGWNGRYYISYPVYWPDPMMGGEEGFRKLVETAHELGMHVVPMYGAVAASIDFVKKEGFEECWVRDRYGNYLMENWVDWDGDRDRDNIWVPLNPGCPKFLEYLYSQITRVTDEFGVDGAFLDITHFYENDPNYSVYEGLRELCFRLRKRYKDFLLFGEGWYDALLPYIPLYHVHTWIPKICPEAFLDYARMTYHLSYPSPGTGSTGVHEQGFLDYRRPDPDKPIIPVVSLTRDTIRDYADEIEKVIEVARNWKLKY